MGGALGLLTRGVGFLGNKLAGPLGRGINFARRTAFTGLQNPFKGKLNQFFAATTLLGGAGSIASDRANPSQILRTSSKYFGDAYNNF